MLYLPRQRRGELYSILFPPKRTSETESQTREPDYRPYYGDAGTGTGDGGLSQVAGSESEGAMHGADEAAPKDAAGSNETAELEAGAKGASDGGTEEEAAEHVPVRGPVQYRV